MNRSSKIKSVIFAVFPIIITAAAVVGVFLILFGGASGLSDALKYAQVRYIVKERYIGTADMDEVNDNAYRMMIASLDDNWSYYMNAEEYDRYKLSSGNQYAGIGVTVSADEESGGMLVSAVNAGTPAQAAGVQAGEIILAIDGESILGLTVAEVAAIIGARQGGVLVLLLRSQDGLEHELSVNCEILYLEPVSCELLEGAIGYVRIDNFGSGSGEAAIAAVEALVSEGAQKLLFDVRANPGGRVTELMLILDHLLPEGEIFVTRDRRGNEEVELSDANCVELPMAVLIDENSYSAAEFFAAVLKEYGWAQLVGAPTTGKARSQATFVLRDGSAVHISNNVYLTPNRIDLSEQGGLVPDLVALPEEGRDSRLEAAINLLDNG